MNLAVSVRASTSSTAKNYRCAKTADCVCSICGKPATGTHYLTISCNGCRSFFRRSIALTKTYNCKRVGYNQQECFLRHRCKHCRLALCISAGMKPEAVQIEEEFDNEEEADDLPDDLQEASFVQQPQSFELKLDKIMLNLLAIDEAHNRLRISSHCPRLVEGMTIDDVALGPTKLGIDFGPMRAQPYDPISIRLVPVEVYINRKMTMDFSSFDYTARKLWMFQDVVYSIEFMKALPIYHLLDDSSQRVLLASAIACANFTTAFYSYSHHSDRTFYPDGGTMSWSKEIQAESPDSTRFHTGIISAIREAELDSREYTLLKIIIVCNPLLDGLSPFDVTLLQHEKERCTKTLLSYVLARRGVKDGPSIFAKLLSIVGIVTRFTSWQKSQHILILALGLWKYRIPFVETIFHSQ